MVFLQLLDPFCVSLLVSFVLEAFMTCLSVALVEAMPLCMPFVAGDQAGGIERGGGTYDLACKELLVNCLAIPCANGVLILYYRS